MLIDQRRDCGLLEGEKEAGLLEGEWRETGIVAGELFPELYYETFAPLNVS